MMGSKGDNGKLKARPCHTSGQMRTPNETTGSSSAMSGVRMGGYGLAPSRTPTGTARGVEKDYIMSVANTVSEVVARARVAQAEFETFDQAAIDNAVCALAWVVMEPGRNRLLAEQAVADTSLGSVEDKVLKNYRKTLGLLRDLKEIRTVGVIAEYPELGLTEIARPVGVVGAVTPSTNPVATPTNKVINAVKGGNAVILAPSPKGEATGSRLVEYFRAALKQI